MLNDHVVRSLYPKAPASHAEGFAERAARAFAVHGLSGSAILYFLATIGHETQGLTRFEENLNYRASRLLQVWPARFRSLEVAAKFEGAPVKLANLVYAARMGNGDEASGDGYRYRGRGYIQLTGRSSYLAIGKEVGLDLVGQPDLVAAPEHALDIATAYWRSQGLLAISSFEGVCRRINGGAIGLDDRRNWLKRVTAILASEGD
ncbi:putative chitinase [Arboricoccus pini]|uniref:Putative chitinase n=1 Tax=Arboricoccus pini TaxID=1963835 RepID=A0A212QPM0_9PROT|nr:glycoside hydrolase family 19 protein [Arboricoccus pini]SNB61372.1 putative chitinase [Arboricoccus pini]